MNTATIQGNALVDEDGEVIAHTCRLLWKYKCYWTSNKFNREGRKYFDNPNDALKAAARTLKYKVI